MKAKPLKRKWARGCWLFLLGILLPWFLGMILPKGAKPLGLAALSLLREGGAEGPGPLSVPREDPVLFRLREPFSYDDELVK